ncbi:MAG TPA: tetratricopeptide repeat protein [Anaerolineales bacterium]|nr:tetratricopeptide repeat protein [Anaerolineales bacterium]
MDIKKTSPSQQKQSQFSNPPALPTGTITFLFTDVEGSTRLWEMFPDQMRLVMARHDVLIEEAVARHTGVVVRPRGEGDSRFAVYSNASDAINAAIAIQRDFSNEPWALPSKPHVRIALHTGEADLRDGDYYGSAVNRCARLRSVAHGGQILISTATYNLVNGTLPGGAILRDLGEFKLKDISQPERIYQVTAPGMESEFPALRTLNYLHTNLPTMLTSFIGREREIEDVRQLLNKTRLLTISGFGGTGKTRLALEVAKGLLNEFTDGIWFVDLAPLPNAALVTQHVMKTLGFREEECCSPLQTLLDSLRQKDMLLILDNCEHLLQGVAEFVEASLRGTQRLRILATSREPLGVAGETLWTIPSLSTPRISGPLQHRELLKFESTQLFLERATAVNTAFTLSEHNASAIAQICARLDGIPLAIELAAARIRALSAEEIAARLDDRFRLLVGNRTAVARQKTLKNLIDWSHDLLPDKECILLRRLPVFSGGWNLRAAEEVCSGGELEAIEVFDLLANLVDKSLVISEEQGGSQRYRLLETIRQYAYERLAEFNEIDAYTYRHAEYFARMVDEAYGGLWGAKQGFWLEQLDEVNDNLNAALEWFASKEDENVLFLHLTGSLWKYWEIRGYVREGRAYLDLALERNPNAPAYERANGLRGAGMLAFLQGDFAQATVMHRESLALFREVGFSLGVGRELAVLGEIALYKGDLMQAIELLTESLAIRYEIEDMEGVAHSLGQLGAIARDRGEYEKARDLLGESLQICRGLGDNLMLAQAWNNLGIVEHLLCHYENAKKSFTEAVTLFRKLDDQPGIAETLQCLGNVAKDKGDFKQAIPLYEESLAIREKIGDKRGIARINANLAEVAFHQGKYPLATELASDSLELFRRLGVKRGTVVAVVILAYVALYQGDCERSEFLARQGLALSKDLTSPRAIAYSKNIIGLCEFSRGNLKSARELLQEAQDIFQIVGDLRNVAYIWVNLARTAYRQGDLDSARNYLEDSLTQSRELDARWATGYVLEIMGLLERSEGNYERALELFTESLNIAIQEENQQGIANCLGAMAGLAALTNQPQRAARLFAAADKIRQAIGANMGINDRQEYDYYLSLLQSQLDQQALDLAWSQGYNLPVDQIMSDRFLVAEE